MNLETEFKNICICLAECKIDFVEWFPWWKYHSDEIKKVISQGDFTRFNCALSSYGTYTYMVKCQKGAEVYLRKTGVLFEHSDDYTLKAEKEYQQYQEQLQQQRMEKQKEKRALKEEKERDIRELDKYVLSLDEVYKEGIRVLPINTKKSDILKLLIEWTELLANEEYEKALSMFPRKNPETKWTAEILEQAVYGYGIFGYTREEIKTMFGSSDYKVTSLFYSPYKNDILKEIDVSYYHMDEKKGEHTLVKNFGEIIGDVHYNSVPLNGQPSDLTARFWIGKMDEDSFTLEFIDLHVM